MMTAGQVLHPANYRTQPLEVPQVSCLKTGGQEGSFFSFAPQAQKEERVKVPMREAVCHVCGKHSFIPAAALSAQCVHCHAHFETGSYVLHSGTRRRVLHTLGNVSVPSGTVLSHVDITCTDLVISGRITGCLSAARKLELKGRARAEGELKAECLCVPSGAHVTLEPSVVVECAEIRGKMEGRLLAKGDVHIYSGGKLVGDCRAGRLLLDPGAVHEGRRLV